MIVQMTNEAIIPIGRSRCGFFTSSAEVANASNPKKAKNTAAPPRKLHLNRTVQMVSSFLVSRRIHQLQ